MTRTNPTIDHTTTPTAPVVPGDLFARHQTIMGLRALADFLEANLGVPVDEYGEYYTFYTRDCDDASAVTLVDHTAALLGVEVTDRRAVGGHYVAQRRFGRITYSIIHIPERRRREHDAELSYRNNIRPDNDQDHDAPDHDDQGAGRAA